MDSSPKRAPLPLPAHEFATTRWSLVLSAAKKDSQECGAALATLCQQYWYPLYAYVRRRVSARDEAQDLTQEFFARLLEKNTLASASAQRGRFRSFLLAAMKNFLANEWDKATARKRGGGHQLLSLDLETGESRLCLEPAHHLTPERFYERQWALTLLQLAMDRLQAELASAGTTRQFELLKGALAGDGRSLSYSSIAAELGMKEAAVRQAAHRLRKRYRQLLLSEVAQTVSDPTDVEEEVRDLFEALGP